MAISVFISYARADRDVVDRLKETLQAHQIRYWEDHEHLEPGTSNWETAIRDNIGQSQALILVASPDAQQSRYVVDELEVARVTAIQIIPVWVHGDEWIKSVPMGWGRTQYIDARGAAQAGGLQQLVATLNARWGTPETVSTDQSSSHSPPPLPSSILQPSASMPPLTRSSTPSSRRLSRRGVLIGSGITAGLVVIGGAVWWTRA